MSRACEVAPGMRRIEKPDPNAKVYYLIEVPLLTDDYKETHRYQFLWFLDQDNEPALFCDDLGSVVAYPGPALRIPMLFEHTFEEARYMADEARDRGATSVANLLKEKQASSTLIPDALDRAQVDRQTAENRSQIGPLSRVQRDAFPTLKDNKPKFGRR